MLPRAVLLLLAALLCACSTARVAPSSVSTPPPPVCPVDVPAAAPAPPSVPTARTQIAVPENNPLEVYPPRASTPAPLILALHGRDQDPVDLCESWSDEGRAHGWLLCPAGNASKGDSFDWSGPTQQRIDALDAQIAAVDDMVGPLVDHAGGDVLVGFSRGAFLARDLVYARPGHFRGVVLLGAAVLLDADRLRAAGVRKIVLAAGDRDEARRTMVHTADKLKVRGLPARFISLGDIPHTLPAELARVMRDALTWVRE